MTSTFSRRAALLGLAAWPGVVTTLPALAQAPVPAPQPGTGPAAGLRFSTVAVDATRVAALGDSAAAERITVVLGREMHREFADLIVPKGAGGATLVARISSLYLTSYVGGRDFGGMSGGGSGNDNLDGVGIVTSGNGVVSQTPILAVLDPGYSGAWYLPNIDELRLQSICHQFAWWLRREMGV